MILEYTINLKNKTKDELIMFIKEQSQYIRKLEKQLKEVADTNVGERK